MAPEPIASAPDVSAPGPGASAPDPGASSDLDASALDYADTAPDARDPGPVANAPDFLVSVPDPNASVPDPGASSDLGASTPDPDASVPDPVASTPDPGASAPYPGARAPESIANGPVACAVLLGASAPDPVASAHVLMIPVPEVPILVSVFPIMVTPLPVQVPVLLNPGASAPGPGASSDLGASTPDPVASTPDSGVSAPDPGATTPNPGASAPDFSAADPGTSSDLGASAPDPGASAPDPMASAPDTSAPDPVASAPDPVASAPDASTPDPVTSPHDPVASAPDPSASAPGPVISGPNHGASNPDPDASAPLPIEDLCSLASRSITVPLTAAIPQSTEDILLKGFTALDMENEKIETAQQFYSWFSKIQTQMDQDEGLKYREMRDYLYGFQEQCDAILNDVNTALLHLESLQKQYLFVSTKTGTLHEACEQLLREQSELVDLAESIQQKLSYFNELENINTKLNSPMLSVNSEGFIPTLAKLDDCITYVSSHPGFRDYPVYLAKFKQCLSKAMHLMKTYTVNTLQNLSTQLNKRDPSVISNTDNAFTLFYVKFRAAAPKVRSLIEQVEQRTEKSSEYQQLLSEIHQCYLDQRGLLLGPSIASTIADLTSQNNRDHCALVRSGCAFLVHVCQDEHRLYNEFFTKPTTKLDLYFSQQRLFNLVLFVALICEQIAQSLKDEQKKLSRPDPSFAEVQLEDSKNVIKSGNSEVLNPRPQSTISPADLHGMWYPTVRRTLVCLSKLYRCIDAQTDGQLFLIKHLLILREQIAPFHTDFAIKEISLDLKKTREAAFKMLNPRSVPRLFRLSSNNSILEFLLEGSPVIKEHYIDSKKEVDRNLKSACEKFIQHQTKLFVGHLEEFMTKVSALKTMGHQGGPKYSLAQQPWAQPAKINDVVTATYKTIKVQLPMTLRSLTLYLSNKDTEFILFKPVRSNIQQTFQKLHGVLQEDFSGEDLQIIACPSMDQINLLLSASN
ncbi:hypothetical protein scyTo_0016077 [Scyliorhinus torazame]|uniref:Conserved oligomeric Golgi complex subunit 3 n=2 Tax=Scyliorhinus torazame TaxID=75743 RepID=A0A401Q3P5_SCYTO|nr:hypothetical protein [Scyliorhinus torazame]